MKCKYYNFPILIIYFNINITNIKFNIKLKINTRLNYFN